ncbi:MAG: flagellar motor switch protein FliN [Candidatus Pelagadaptatus aseana]|uniref:flagellar motor switch protein FliN n=1 Tax=Candidatus Pelagadaptatus aseana TaxID=3120508 RepID=UPI0039B2D9CE
MSDEDDLMGGEEGDVNQDAMADEWAAAMAEAEDSASDPIDDVSSVELEEFAPSEPQVVPGEGNPDLDTILDIPVTISMEVGATSITIRNLLQLNQGSVIELDRLAGEPLDVLVNGTLIAHGEVVVVNEKFGIRMTDVISPSERIKRLR